MKNAYQSGVGEWYKGLAHEFTDVLIIHVLELTELTDTSQLDIQG